MEKIMLKHDRFRDINPPLNPHGYSDPSSAKFLSQEECSQLLNKATVMSVGGGQIQLSIESEWTGNIRYARNAVISSGDVRNNDIVFHRSIEGARGVAVSNQIGSDAMQRSLRRAERMSRLNVEPFKGDIPFLQHFDKSVDPFGGKGVAFFDAEKMTYEDGVKSLVQVHEPHAKPEIFFDTTLNMDDKSRLDMIAPLMEKSKQHGLLSAGYMEVSARGRAVMSTVGVDMYYPFTSAQFSLTVRDPKGTGSGWAGVDWANWSKIDGASLTEIAIDKCLRSRNPVAVEPGRYTAILESQAVHDLFSVVIQKSLERLLPEQHNKGPWALGEGNMTKIGLRVLDERITVTSDPHDSELGFVPFNRNGDVFNKAVWFEKGVLKELEYTRGYGIKYLNRNSGLPSSGAYRMAGGSSSVEEMIATTKRGVLVSRFHNVSLQGPVSANPSLMCQGYTRDGLWLVENGAITKAIKNFRFVDSPLFAFNSLDQLGEPVRVFSPGYPAIVPPAKIRDFNFASLTDAI